MSVILSSMALAHTLVKPVLDARELIIRNVVRPLGGHLHICMCANETGPRVVKRDEGGFKEVLYKTRELT